MLLIRFDARGWQNEQTPSDSQKRQNCGPFFWGRGKKSQFTEILNDLVDALEPLEF